MSQKPVRADAPSDHQQERHRQRYQRDAAPYHQRRHEVHHNRQSDPREAERLYETQDEFASVVHDDEVVEVVEVEGCEAEERDDARLEEAVLLVQLVVGVEPAQAQVRRRHHRQEDEQRLGCDEQQRPKV